MKPTLPCFSCLGDDMRQSDAPRGNRSWFVDADVLHQRPSIRALEGVSKGRHLVQDASSNDGRKTCGGPGQHDDRVQVIQQRPVAPPSRHHRHLARIAVASSTEQVEGDHRTRHSQERARGKHLKTGVSPRPVMAIDYETEARSKQGSTHPKLHMSDLWL